MDTPPLTGFGHNQPPPSLDPELLSDQLSLDYAHHLQRCRELIAAVARFVIANGGSLAKVATERALGEAPGDYAFVEDVGAVYGLTRPRGGNPEWKPVDVVTLARLIGTAVIRDGATEAKAISFVKQLKETAKGIDQDRVREKQPYDAAADAVQAFFKTGLTDKLTTAAKAIEATLNTYGRWKVEEERKRREAEAQQAREEAARVAAVAQATEHPDVMDTAVALADEADRKARAAAAPVADLARGRGSLGGTSSYRRNWTVTVTNVAAVPDRYKVVDTAAMLRDIRAAKGAIEIAGVSITETSSTVVV